MIKYQPGLYLDQFSNLRIENLSRAKKKFVQQREASREG
jgi:hypothetical protein